MFFTGTDLLTTPSQCWAEVFSGKFLKSEYDESV
jgi:hypothetical protein